MDGGGIGNEEKGEEEGGGVGLRRGDRGDPGWICQRFQLAASWFCLVGVILIVT